MTRKRPKLSSRGRVQLLRESRLLAGTQVTEVSDDVVATFGDKFANYDSVRTGKLISIPADPK